MLDPIQIILKYFKPAARNPDASTIAEPGVLAGLLPVLAAAIGILNIVPLSAAERQAFQRKDPAGQRQVSRGLLRLARRRPHLAALAGINPDTYDEIIKKDESFDILYQVLGQILQILDDGLLLVRASLSESITTVVDFVNAALQAGDLGGAGLGPDVVGRLRVYFSGVDLTALEHAQKQADKQQRQDRALKAGQAAVAEAHSTLQDQPAIDRLREAALKGATIPSLHQPAGGRGHKGGKP